MTKKKLLCTTDQFQQLLCLIKNDAYKLLGPTIRNEVIIYDEIQSAQDLPIGWMDEQDPGRYRLKRRSDQAYFGYNLGPHSWKKYLFPPSEKLFSARKQENGMVVFQETVPPVEKMAFIGVRSCEMQAIFIQDKVFNHKLAVYKQYQQRRDNLFLVAVNCTRSVNTCFCVSMESGPEVKEGYDLSLTEIINDKEHYFVIVVGSAKGEFFCDQLDLQPAEQTHTQLANQLIRNNEEQMVRQVDNGRVHAMLEKSWNAKRWDTVAKRCINCANCTMVCPTCFCSETEDKVSLDGTHVDRWQQWDSCFNLSHSFVHGGSIRESAKSRYRQWLTHKFGTWWDQFGTSGCVGCGRCIAWCPVGIDVTEELRELQIECNENNS
ncbi:MAG: 4Fe-4S dicluster domain-containing protein [Simkania sp.]|nr:4Fe-4S dicluster domain-containing protein [Simkania sp.]